MALFYKYTTFVKKQILNLSHSISCCCLASELPLPCYSIAMMLLKKDILARLQQGDSKATARKQQQNSQKTNIKFDFEKVA